MKLRICVHFSKSNPYYQGRQFKMHFFFFFFNYACFYTPQNSVWGVYRSQLVCRSVRRSVGRSVCSFLSALFLINYWTNFIQTSQVNSVSSRDVHMKCWLWFIDFSLSYGPFMKFLVLHSCDINLFCDKELLEGMITISDSSSLT